VTTNLQAAINAAPNGSTIYVPAGSWGGATINGRSNLTIYGSRTTSIIGTLSIVGGSSNIVVHDVTLKDSYSTDWNPGIQIESLKGGHFYNMDFVGMGYSAINAANSTVSWDANITNIEVDHNNVYGPVGEYGFYVGRGCYYWNLHDNNVGQCVGKTTPPHAFYIQDSAYITVQNNYAYGTTASNGFAYKVAVDSYGQGHSHDVTFTNNKSDGNFGGLWLVATVNCTASGNQFLNNTNQAVQFWANNDNVTLQNNTMTSALYGITFATDGAWSSNVHLIDNTCTAPVPLSLGGGPSSMIVESTSADLGSATGSTYKSLPTTRYEQSDSRLAYAGPWTTWNTGYASGNSCNYSNLYGASVTVNFTGTYLSWIGIKGPLYGIASTRKVQPRGVHLF
jgi:parallel beta-helix repeat protein